MRFVGEKTVCHVSCGKQPNFPAASLKFQVKCRMECGLVHAVDYT